MTSETKSSIDGHWSGYYQTIEDQMSGKKNHFKLQLSSSDDSTLNGQILHKAVIPGHLEGRIDGDFVKFTTRVRTDVPRSVFEGTIGADGKLSGKCQIGSGTGTRSGTWYAERYQATQLESFFDGERRVSVLLLLIAAGAFYLGVVQPDLIAQSHDEKIAVGKCVKYFCIFGLVGIIGLIFGKKATKFFIKHLVDNKSKKGKMTMAAVMVVAGLLNWLLVLYLQAHGYFVVRLR